MKKLELNESSNLSIKAELPRERLLAHGADVLTSSELLAIILRTGTRGCNVVSLSHNLINHFGGLRALLQADAKALLKIKGLGAAKVCELIAVSEINRRVLEEDLRAGSLLNESKRVKQYAIANIGSLKIEHCMAFYLDTKFRLIASEEVSRGTLNQASVYPREIVKAALRHHAAALILAHNHPSGVTEPSQADIRLTQHLKKALSLVDVMLIDHLIVTANDACSLAERGLL